MQPLGKPEALTNTECMHTLGQLAICSGVYTLMHSYVPQGTYTRTFMVVLTTGNNQIEGTTQMTINSRNHQLYEPISTK